MPRDASEKPWGYLDLLASRNIFESGGGFIRNPLLTVLSRYTVGRLDH